MALAIASPPMDIQEAAALAACSSLDNHRGLETLRTLIKNITDRPSEDRFRDVSLDALEKRGLTCECLTFLESIGFVKEGGRLCFRMEFRPDSTLCEGLAAIEDILEQRAKAHETVAKRENAAINNNSTIIVSSSNSTNGRTGMSNASVISDIETRQPLQQQDIVTEEEKLLVEMGFPLVMVRDAIAGAGTADIDTVLPVLLSMEEVPTGTNLNPPELVRGVSSESGNPPDMPSLERHLSNEAKEVLSDAFRRDEKFAKDTARMLLSLGAALRQGLLTRREKQDLHAHILQGQLDEVQNIIKAMRIQPMPEMLMPHGEPRWECKICFDRQHTNGWKCPSKHRFCYECMHGHIDSVAFPSCPMCDYALCEADLLNLNISHSRIEAFQEAKLRGAVDTLAKCGECLVRCSRPECSNVVVLASSGRQRFSCEVCNAPPFCTRCRQAPYHYYASCGRVQPLREQWVAWISGGRETYTGQVRTAVESDRRNQSLCDAPARHNELEADERWKAENCRHCPSCDRPISKVEGCDSMVCGRSYHGGDQQPGCGTEFNWASAKRYEAHIQRRELPTLTSEASRLRGKHVFHPFTDCSLCGAQGLTGPRFRCIHCQNFDVCSNCEPRMADLHEPDHVFEILFESDFRCPWLPRQTRVNIVRSGEKKPQSLKRCAVSDVEGLCGTVINRRRGPLEAYFVELDLGQGQIEIDPMFLEPIITSRADAEQLLLKTLEEDGEEPPLSLQLPHRTPRRSVNVVSDSGSDEGPDEDGHVPRRGQRLGRGAHRFEQAFADDSPLSSPRSSDNENQRVVRPRLQQPHRPYARHARPRNLERRSCVVHEIDSERLCWASVDQFHYVRFPFAQHVARQESSMALHCDVG